MRVLLDFSSVPNLAWQRVDSQLAHLVYQKFLELVTEFYLICDECGEHKPGFRGDRAHGFDAVDFI